MLTNLTGRSQVNTAGSPRMIPDPRVRKKGAEEEMIGEKGYFKRLFNSRTMETGDPGRRG
jgi:hypothetical protein